MRGWPRDTVVAVEWIDRATAADGAPYASEETHVIRLRGGKLAYLYDYPDTQEVAGACDRLAANGVAEAAAPPIEA